jgi:hypothetical protein
MKVKCKQCTKEFDKRPSQIKRTKNNFCTHSCAAIYNNRKHPKRVAICLCIVCGYKISRQNAHCHVCRRKNDATIQEKLYHKKGPWKYNPIRRRAKSVLELENRPKICEDCGWESHVEIAHIQPISTFPLTTKIAEVNAPTNLKYLCPNCHWLLDHSTTKL